MQGLAAHIDVQDQFNVIHNPSASRDEVTVALRNLSLDNSLQRQANAEIDARTIQLHRLQQLWNSLNCSGVTTVNFPQQTTAHLDNVSGEPYEAIGATYFGYDHSPPAVTGSGFAPDEAVTLSINPDSSCGVDFVRGWVLSALLVVRAASGLTGWGCGGLLMRCG